MNPKLFLIVFSVALVQVQVVFGVSSLSVIGQSNGISIIPDTNLLTGVNYRIDFPEYNFGVLTYAEISGISGNGGKFLQMDDHVQRIGDYAEGGKWYNDTLWSFYKSDIAGYYRIGNAGVNGGHGVLSVTMPQDHPKDQPLYPKASYLTVVSSSTNVVDQELTLWRVTPAKQQDQYFLINKKIPGVVIETPRYGEFYKFVIIGSPGSSCRATDPALKFTAISLV